MRRMGMLVAVACLFVIVNQSTARKLRSDGLEMEVQHVLNRLNRPPVQSIQSPDGDIVDCISINLQPAFDNPILKDHAIQMRPTSEPKDRFDQEESNLATQLWHTTNTSCPDGTVPIRRTKEGNLLRARSIDDFGKNNFFTNSPSFTRNPHEYATVDVGSGIYYGAGAKINVWKPEIERPDEFSSSQIGLSAGSLQEDNLNVIEVGWQVNPHFYGDSNPRFFLYWTADSYQSSGCYNLLCPGFVQVSKKIYVGATIAPISTYAGTSYDIALRVWKDKTDRKWWLKFGNEVVGYWPVEVFTKLADAATDVVFGGEIVNLSENGHTTTDMGSGHFAEEGANKASFFKNVETVDADNNPHDVAIYPYASSNSNCYNIKIARGDQWGTYFFYGGPGKNPNCQ